MHASKEKAIHLSRYFANREIRSDQVNLLSCLSPLHPLQNLLTRAILLEMEFTLNRFHVSFYKCLLNLFLVLRIYTICIYVTFFVLRDKIYWDWLNIQPYVWTEYQKPANNNQALGINNKTHPLHYNCTPNFLIKTAHYLLGWRFAFGLIE